MNVREYNRLAWNEQVEQGNRWTIPVDSEVVAAARRGQWEIFLTPSKPVPKEWFPALAGLDLLCLASGGGQQGPILAAAGARVTVLDNSPRQLEQDRMVAERDGLSIRTVEGDMADLEEFADGSFDLIVHPVSNTFVPDVRPVWREAYRVLRGRGSLLAGFGNPAIYLFDYELADRTGVLRVKYVLPYADTESLSTEERYQREQEGSPLEFSHTLQDQIGGQIEAGFGITGFYEDRHEDEEWDILGRYMSTYIATRAIKAPDLQDLVVNPLVNEVPYLQRRSVTGWPPGSVGDVSARLGYDVRDLRMAGYSQADIDSVLHGHCSVDDLLKRGPKREGTTG